MKRILISIFILFMLASCNVFKAPFDIDSIDVTIDEQVEVKVVVSVKDEKNKHKRKRVRVYI